MLPLQYSLVFDSVATPLCSFRIRTQPLTVFDFRRLRVLQDPFGNYVVQSCLSVVKGPVHEALVEKIRPHLHAIKTSPYGKRILDRSHLFAQRPRDPTDDAGDGLS